MSDFYQNREVLRITIESRILISWFDSGEVEIPNTDKSRHVVLSSDSKHIPYFTDYKHYFVLEGEHRMLAVYRVNGFYPPRLRRLEMVPSAVLEGKGISFEEFLASYDEQDELEKGMIFAGISNYPAGEVNNLSDILWNAFSKNGENRMSA